MYNSFFSFSVDNTCCVSIAQKDLCNVYRLDCFLVQVLHLFRRMEYCMPECARMWPI